MGEEARIKERVEGERKHVWWDTERHFPFLTMGQGWQFCPYCGGFRFKQGEKFIFPRYKRNEKGEDLPVEKDIGCINFSLSRQFEVVAENKPEAAAPEPKKVEEPAPPPAESPKGKKKGFMKGFRGK